MCGRPRIRPRSFIWLLFPLIQMNESAVDQLFLIFGFFLASQHLLYVKGAVLSFITLVANIMKTSLDR